LYDPSFGPTELRQQIRKSDFKKYSNLNLEEEQNKEYQLSLAYKIGTEGFSELNLQSNQLAGKLIYQLVDFPSELILRKAMNNIATVTRVKQTNRIEICSCLKLLCQEGIPYSLAKFDIQNFYESIDQTQIETLITKRLSTLPSTRRVLSTFIQQCNGLGITGLPRGLAISATLSELHLNDFDKNIQNKLDLYFYARYVDDIIILLPEREIKNLCQKVSAMLPIGLKLNKSKNLVLNFNARKNRTCQWEGCFDYLGFSFKVSHILKNGQHRFVQLNIAESKVKKIKTRVIRALLQYRSDGNFDDLHDRIKILTCNYRYYDHRKQRGRLAGNYHNYKLVDNCSHSLVELDQFIIHILLSKKGKLGTHLANSLTKKQRQILLGMSFQKGFKNRIHFRFSPARLKKLVECWKYG